MYTKMKWNPKYSEMAKHTHFPDALTESKRERGRESKNGKEVEGEEKLPPRVVEYDKREREEERGIFSFFVVFFIIFFFFFFFTSFPYFYYTYFIYSTFHFDEMK